MTCDDFDQVACDSCFDQNYSSARFFICDDSAGNKCKDQVDEWAKANEKAIVIRRPNRSGFKAGNLNNVIASFVREEFILICDADEVLECNFVRSLLPYFDRPDIGFVQARHCVSSLAVTRFAELLGRVTDIFFNYNLPLRNRFGFVSCFGHGVMIRRSVWQEIGGFPEMTSEDLAFASRALAAGYRGVYAEEVVAREAFPPSYTALLRKYRRVVEGTIEYFTREFPRLVRSPQATWTEKVDLFITYSSCFMGLVWMINLVGGLILIRAYAKVGYTRLEPWLMLLYLAGPFLPVAPLVIHIAKEPRKYVQLFFAGAITYASLLPSLALRALVQLLGSRIPSFEPTGKIARQRQRRVEPLLISMTGAVVFSLAMVSHSSSYVPSAGIGLMLILGPLLCFAEVSNVFGIIVRNCGLIPYAVMVFLYFAWR
ncbi:MAG TPA: glycosyltransferase family 2 protein [Pyrinomonadaceae bacterium]|nr:glycosyltransferase family 2 protein [Pyrinomonadaceae bacterium]